MIYREFAKSGFKTSVIGMGTYYDSLWIAAAMLFKGHRGEVQKLSALKAGLDGGINFIDTAEIYQSEGIVARAIAGRKRDELFLATKVWSNHLRPDKLEKALRRSLSRLNTRYVDLYQVHFPSSRVPIAETMGAMEKLVDEGVIRNIGVSNFSYNQLIAAEAAMKKHEISSTQMHYNMLRRDVEEQILPHCEKERIAMIAYYPLAHGKLARTSGESVERIMRDHNCSSRSQVALAWLVARSPVNFPIPRASREEHVKEDVSAGDVALSPEEMKSLESL